MSNISKSANLSFFLDGNEIDAPVQWADIAILATFENDNVQANITIDDFDFINEARQAILNHIADGRIFEGLPFQIVASGTNNSLTVFDGYIDLTEGFQDLQDSLRAVCRIAKKDGLNTLEERLQALNYDYLYELGEITDADFIDVPYVVEKFDNTIETALLLFMVAFLADALIQQVADTATAIASIAGMTILGKIIFAVASAIIQAAKLAAMILAFAELSRRVFELLVQPKRTHKAMLLKSLLEKAVAHLGYGFETDIADLDNIVYLASNTAVDERGAIGQIVSVKTIDKGIPNVQDYGFNCLEMFELAINYTNSRIAIVGSKVQFRSKDSAYWQKTASYTMPDILIDAVQYNTDEMVANKLFSFDTDIADEWTVESFTGTNYEVITDATDAQNQKFIKGLQQVRYNVCLGSRKDKRNAVESVLAFLAGLFDSVINVFGGSSNLSGSFDSVTGVLRVSQNNHSKPKLIWLSGGEIPANQRDLLSAKVSYNSYHYYDSFILGNFNGQKKLFSGVKSGFGLDDFVKLIENSYFYTNDGQLVQATKVESNLSLDFATLDFFVRQPYTRRLSETYIEP